MTELPPGTQLTVETEPRSEDIKFLEQIVLETYDFQAPIFYQKLGFQTVGRISDYPRGHEFLMLVKHLGHVA
jgi:ribosomal protein S18 acetylase RimI-like enzyme